MAEKNIKWVTDTEAVIEILDGPAKGAYRINIEENIPIGGMIKLAEIKHQGKLVRLMIKTEDIPEYAARYARSPYGLRQQRESLADKIAGILDEQRYRRERAFQRDTGCIPQYDTPDYKLAVKALEEFDAAHPEIISGIRAEKERNINIWQ